LNIDDIEIDGVKVPVVSGTMKVDDQNNVSVDCAFSRPDRNHTLKAHVTPASGGDKLQLDQNVISGAKLKFKVDLDSPTFGGVLGGLLGGGFQVVTAEGQVDATFTDATGRPRKIRISTEKV
jgi:hypothetical protein